MSATLNLRSVFYFLFAIILVKAVKFVIFMSSSLILTLKKLKEHVRVTTIMLYVNLFLGNLDLYLWCFNVFNHKHGGFIA